MGDLREVSLPLQATDMALQPFLGVDGRVEKTAEGSMSVSVSAQGLTQGIKLRQRIKSVFDFTAGGTHVCALVLSAAARRMFSVCALGSSVVCPGQSE